MKMFIVLMLSLCASSYSHPVSGMNENLDPKDIIDGFFRNNQQPALSESSKVDATLNANPTAFIHEELHRISETSKRDMEDPMKVKDIPEHSERKDVSETAHYDRVKRDTASCFNGIVYEISKQIPIGVEAGKKRGAQVGEKLGAKSDGEKVGQILGAVGGINSGILDGIVRYC